MKLKIVYKNILIILTVTLFFVSCSTKKNRWINRTYHNVTSKYNIFFNGNEALKSGVNKIVAAHQDNYTLILPVFQYSDESAAQSGAASMEKAIKKASKVIKKHSITEKPKRKSGKLTQKQKDFYARKEYCNWIDDSYLMMGKANFYSRNFFEADNSFNYVISRFSDPRIKYEAYLWLARSYSEQKRYSESIEILERLDGDRKFPRKLKKELATIFADSYLKQNRYNEAIPWLRKAIDQKGKKRVKARYKFILAQIYQSFGKNANASNLYKEVIKMNPPYEMAFRAKINRATSYDVSAGGGNEIKRQLNKMLKDDKNIDYQDQIYYALANVYYAEKNEQEAIKDYKLSVKVSTSNTDQQALSYLAIADIYFAKPNYKYAQAYYDSCVNILDQKFPKYEEIKLKAENLSLLVENINIIEREDSLQMVAGLSEKKRNSFIDNLIKKVIEEEQRQKELEAEAQRNSMLFDQNIRENNSRNIGGKWYFYNPTAMGFGASEFRKKWGTRKLEDNWRRKNKSVIMNSNEDDIDDENDTLKKISDNKTREFYLANLPLTDSLINVSNKKIEEAIYKVSEYYKTKLNDYPQSIKSFEELIKRFPNTKYLLLSYYNLYQQNMLIENKPRADYYKNLIINNYPESKYAKSLSDPNYIKKVESENKKNYVFYTTAYSNFEQNNYFESLHNLEKVDTNNLTDDLGPQVLLLKALSYGGIRDISNYRKELKKVIKEYPKSDAKITASKILARLNSPDFVLPDTTLLVENTNIIKNETPKDTIKKVDTIPENKDLYTFDENAKHYYFIIVNSNTNDVNRLKFNIINYNIDKFPMFDFEVKAQKINKSLTAITVQSLDNLSQARKYYKAINRKNRVIDNIEKTDFKQFVISKDNYNNFIKNLDIKKYEEFYLKNYSK